MIHERTVIINGLTGKEKVSVPTNQPGKIGFITLINYSNTVVYLKPSSSGVFYAQLPPYGFVTIPISPDIQNDFFITWENLMGMDTLVDQTVKIIFSSNNLNMNGTLAPSFDYLQLYPRKVVINNRKPKETINELSYNGDYIFNETMNGFVITNDGSEGGESLTFTIHGLTFEVKPHETFEADFDEFRVVTINSPVPFRAYGRGS